MRWLVLTGVLSTGAAFQMSGCADCGPCDYDTTVVIVAIDPETAQFEALRPGDYVVRFEFDAGAVTCSVVVESEHIPAAGECDRGGVAFVAQEGVLHPEEMVFSFDGTFERGELSVDASWNDTTFIEEQTLYTGLDGFVAPEEVPGCRDRRCHPGGHFGSLWVPQP